MDSKIISKFFIIFLLIAIVKAAVFIDFESLENNEVKPGQELKVNVTVTQNSDERKFEVVLRNEDNTYHEVVRTIRNSDYEFTEGKKFEIKVDIPENIKEDSYFIYAYIGEEKVSHSLRLSVKNETSNTPSGTKGTQTKSPNSKPTDSNKKVIDIKEKEEEDSFEWNTKNVVLFIILGSVVFVLLILIFYCCCVKNTKESGYSNDVWKIPASVVSSPKLISSSTPINATPLWKNGNNNIGNVNAITSPIVHSNSYQNRSPYNMERESLTIKNRNSDQIMTQQNTINQQKYRDTIYSNNSGYYTDEMNTQDEVASPTPSYYFQVFKPQQVYRVLYDFEPSLPDEMEIQTGDIIRTEETFEDGWAFGINMTTGKQGTFPMNCLEDDYTTDADSRSHLSDHSHSQRGNRTSSLPNNQAIQRMLNDISKPQQSYYSSQVNKIRV